ncbi:MAG TPA: rhomboid family intramembrane serine protease [Gemmataceae bacterium]|nr:rhomboid family intramembrane serine protease [Gemmataceae bacterium]
MIFPYTVDVPMARVPFANWGLMAVTSLVSIAILLGVGASSDRPTFVQRQDALRKVIDEKTTREERDKALEILARDETDPIYPLALRPSAFSLTQLLSYVFVHADLWHLLGNMGFLFVFGNAVNAKVGHGWFLGFYFVLGMLAGLAWLVLGRGQPMVGASGAIMGIVGIFLVLFPNNEVSCWWSFGWWYYGETHVPSWLLIVFYFGCDLFGAIYGGGGTVAYISHLAGAMGGITLATTLVANGWYKPTRYEENLLQTLGFKESRRGKRLEEV